MGKSKNSKYYIENDEYDHKNFFQDQRKKRKDKEKSREINIDDDLPANGQFIETRR